MTGGLIWLRYLRADMHCRMIARVWGRGMGKGLLSRRVHDYLFLWQCFTLLQDKVQVMTFNVLQHRAERVGINFEDIKQLHDVLSAVKIKATLAETFSTTHNVIKLFVNIVFPKGMPMRTKNGTDSKATTAKLT